MTGKELNRKTAEPARKDSGLRGHIAAIIALFALAVVAMAWFWSTRQPLETALPNGLIVAGAGAFVTAAIAYVRGMDLMDVFEMLGEAFMGLFALIGAILNGIWSAICGIFGWD